jgi:hypothetical protein
LQVQASRAQAADGKFAGGRDRPASAVFIAPSCSNPEPNVAKDHLDRPTRVNLKRDNARVRRLLEVVIDGDFAVELDGDVFADRLDGVVVPVPFLRTACRS